MSDSAPTTLPGLNAFVDLSHLDLTVDLRTARAAGLAGVLHKATQHTDFEDPCYAERLAQSRELGLLTGAYHFCTAASVDRQLDHFLRVLDRHDRAGVLPCVDWEPNPATAQGTLSRIQLFDFVEKFQARTGVYPVLYGGYWMLEQLGNLHDPGPLCHCPLWQGFYSHAFGYLTSIWDRWTFLQYTDGTLGPLPHKFEGIGAVDRNLFNGDLTAARRFWECHALLAR
ncbi:MAG: glycoside hydrolase family 25 protein [Burkholderiaceae bacterium]